MSEQRQLFGTDGIRGVAGEFPLTPESTYVIGRALGHDLVRNNPKARTVIGQDTRESSQWIADQVMQGLTSHGVSVESAGVITTPGVAYLARSRGFDAGVVISASHNPWTDNGIKVFSGDGYKLPDERELAIEQEIFRHLQSPASRRQAGEGDPASLPGAAGLRRAYIDWLAHNVSADLSRLKVLVDCANGAATAEAPELFQACRIQATFLNAKPDGQNINEGCGALHPENVAKAIREMEGQFDLGVTFDGDADRALFSDARGRVVNGDAVLLLTARDMQARGVLSGNTLVATTMSNMGLEVALKRSGVAMLRANVGDKYVLAEMLKTGATLGGEQSGHIIFRDGDATTGDGLLTALRVMEIMARTGRPLADLISDLRVFPQTIQNVRVREKVPFSKVPEVQHAIESAERELNGNGRVVVRYSGTEALARVMVEAESEDKMHALTGSIADAIKQTLGPEPKTNPRLEKGL
ncbi:MAG: phosphoglucosamine mutase [Acidobacteria bacterium]|nr:MAG: phosphoglucosamine mutase [Acidobacteriota bacterium]PYY07810.1 MAG: phosphoglucosamine mutase [Acidobacteriota bacterium]